VCHAHEKLVRKKISIKKQKVVQISFFFGETRALLWANVHLEIRIRELWGVKGKKVRTTSDDAGGKSVSKKSKSTGGKCASERKHTLQKKRNSTSHMR